MIDVFISYGSEDRLKAAVLAELFSEIGWNVWWDKKYWAVVNGHQRY